MFGLAAKWKRANWRPERSDRLTRLAAAIEALAERDRRRIEESLAVEQMRAEGASALHALCALFVGKVNSRLPEPALILDPPEFSEANYSDARPNLIQISLRGRLLQIEFGAMEDLYSRDDFRLPYILRGIVRSFNQEMLESNGVGEQSIFCCPEGGGTGWHFFDSRTYRTGPVSEDYLIAEFERLL